MLRHGTMVVLYLPLLLGKTVFIFKQATDERAVRVPNIIFQT
jgi:hypothetical protein